MDLSNEAPAPPSYEEPRRPAEIHLQATTYEKLTPKPAVYMNNLS